MIYQAVIYGNQRIGASEFESVAGQALLEAYVTTRSPLCGNRSGITTKRPRVWLHQHKKSEPTKVSSDFLVGVSGFACIFADGENRGFAPSSRREQQSTGLLHLDHSNPDTIKNPKPAKADSGFLVGVSGFEPEASWTRTKRDTKLRHTPIATTL